MKDEMEEYIKKQMKNDMKKVSVLVAGTIELNKFYNEGLKRLSKEYKIPPSKMKKRIGRIIRPPKLRKDNVSIFEFFEAYRFLMMELADEVAIMFIGIQQLEIFSVHIGDWGPEQLKNFHYRTTRDIVLFLNLLTMARMDMNLLTEEEQKFFREFTDSLLE